MNCESISSKIKQNTWDELWRSYAGMILGQNKNPRLTMLSVTSWPGFLCDLILTQTRFYCNS
jgi:hypothetical protein